MARQMGQIERAIRAALGQPTPQERIEALLALDTRPGWRGHGRGDLAGLPGVAQLRARQQRLRSRYPVRPLRHEARDVAALWAIRLTGRDGPGWGGLDEAAWEASRRGEDVRAAVRRYRSWHRAHVRAAHQRAQEEAREREARAALAARYTAAVVARGGETEIVGGYGSASLEVADRAGGLVLLRAEGWRQYSRSYGARPATLAYLCGTDDSGDWAVRVPGTTASVREALEWMEPAAVRRARAAGRPILRQGDVYAVRGRRCDDQRGEPVGTRHGWSSDGRWLLHPEHAPLQVPWPARLYAQRAYEMGRSGRRGAAD